MEGTTLFERLGGSPGIAALVDDIIGAHMQNPVIGPRFQPYLDKPETLAVAKQHLCTFIAAGSGGPQEYAGRSMRDAHRGMNISEAEYMAAMDDILSVLARRGVDQLSRQEVLAITYSLKQDILHV
ncbi:MAG: group 1 truncated hemoglobin [Acidobacteriota bacterium]|nr:group 1 truncated hemoglobin [Acidobacteriota bacterium]